MTVKELITYLLNFNMNDTVCIKGKDNNILINITNDPHSCLGNGNIKNDVGYVTFVTTEEYKKKSMNN